MPAYRDIASSFLAGELDPATSAQVDDATRANGAAKIRNMYVRSAGGVRTRPGMRVVARVTDDFLTPDPSVEGVTGTTQLLPAQQADRVRYEEQFAGRWQPATLPNTENGQHDGLVPGSWQALRIWWGALATPYVLDSAGTPQAVSGGKPNTLYPQSAPGADGTGGVSVTINVDLPEDRETGTHTTTFRWEEYVPDGVGGFRWELGTGANVRPTISNGAALTAMQYKPVRVVYGLAFGLDAAPAAGFADRYIIDSVRSGRATRRITRERVRLVSMNVPGQAVGADADETVIGLFFGNSLLAFRVRSGDPSQGLLDASRYAPSAADPRSGIFDPSVNAIQWVTGWTEEQIGELNAQSASQLSQMLYEAVRAGDGVNHGEDTISIEVESATLKPSPPALPGETEKKTQLMNGALVIGYRQTRPAEHLPRLFCPNSYHWPVQELTLANSGVAGRLYLQWGPALRPVNWLVRGFGASFLRQDHGLRTVPTPMRTLRDPVSGTSRAVPETYSGEVEPTTYQFHEYWNASELDLPRLATGGEGRLDPNAWRRYRHPATLFTQPVGYYDRWLAGLVVNGSPDQTIAAMPATTRRDYDVWRDWKAGVWNGIYGTSFADGAAALADPSFGAAFAPDTYYHEVGLARVRVASGKVVVGRHQIIDGGYLRYGGGPRTMLWSQGRMLVAGTSEFPSGWWGTEYARLADWGPRFLDGGPSSPPLSPSVPGREITTSRADVANEKQDPTPRPSLATDAFFIQNAGARENSIYAMYPSRRLVFFGDRGVFFLESEAIDAQAIGFRWNTDRGIKPGVPPIGIGLNRIAYATNDGRSIWLLTYTSEDLGFRTQEISAAVPHLIRQPLDMIYNDQLSDGSTIILVNNEDGTLACCAIEPEAEWYAWSQWETPAVRGRILDVENAGGDTYCATTRGPPSAVYLEVFDDTVELDFCERTTDGTHRWIGGLTTVDVIAEGTPPIYAYNLEPQGRHAAWFTVNGAQLALTDEGKEDIGAMGGRPASYIGWWQIGKRFTWELETLPFVRRTGSGTTYTRRSITKEVFVDIQGVGVDDTFSAIGPTRGAMRVNGEDLSHQPQLFVEDASRNVVSAIGAASLRFLNLAGWRNENSLRLEGHAGVTISGVSRKVFA